jgi:hypothetical protein
MEVSGEICVGIETLKLAPSDRPDHLRLKGCILEQISKKTLREGVLEKKAHE